MTTRISLATKHCTITGSVSGPCMKCGVYIDGPTHLPFSQVKILCPDCCPCSGGRLLSELTPSEMRQAEQPVEQGRLF